MKRHISLRTLTPITLALALGCSAEDPGELGSVHVKSAVISAADGGDLVVTADDYAPYAGTRLEVPANALAEDTKLTIGLGPDTLMDADAQAVGPAIEFGPSGTEFAAPVSITLPLTEALDATLARIYVRHADGTREVLLPADITVDDGTVRFRVDHFTAFQPGRAGSACAHVSCPAGQQCQGGQCQNNGGNNSGPCQPADCGPAPGAPNYTCPDGTIGGPVCERSAAGTCGWNFVTCPACTSDADCVAGESCTAAGMCVANTGGSCGNTTCGNSEYCCNPSCGICAPVGGSCTQQVCGSTGGGGNPGGGPGGTCSSDADCPSGELCTAAGLCAPGTRCGNSICGNSQYCCNSSCSICAPLGASCTQQLCSQPCSSNADCGALGMCVNGFCQ